jgi:glucose-1-phosphate thymidylyltransferase
MKGIILAGGSGTRLTPMTTVVSKQLLPIFDKPMIFYPLTTLMLAGIRDVLIISTRSAMPMFHELLGQGDCLGMKFSYRIQEAPKGIAEAIILAEGHIVGGPCALILGDNLFYADGLSKVLQQAAADVTSKRASATFFVHRVKNPQDYGILSAPGSPRTIVEKPKDPPSDLAVTGLYFYDKRAAQFASRIKPSARGELEITDLNNRYLQEDPTRVQVTELRRGTAWLDTGTPESLLEASQFVATVQNRQGVLIGCPEEVAYRMGYIDRVALEALADGYGKSSYAEYLWAITEE